MSTITVESLKVWNEELDKRRRRYGERRWLFNLWGETNDAWLSFYEQEEGKIDRIEKYIEAYDCTYFALKVVRRMTGDWFIEQKRAIVTLSRLKTLHTEVSEIISELEKKKQTYLSAEDFRQVTQKIESIRQRRQKVSYFSMLRNQLNHLLAAFKVISIVIEMGEVEEISQAQRREEKEAESETNKVNEGSDPRASALQLQTQLSQFSPMVEENKPSPAKVSHETHPESDSPQQAVLPKAQPDPIESPVRPWISDRLTVEKEISRDRANLEEIVKKVKQYSGKALPSEEDELKKIWEEALGFKELYYNLLRKYHSDKSARYDQAEDAKKLCIRMTRELIEKKAEVEVIKKHLERVARRLKSEKDHKRYLQESEEEHERFLQWVGEMEQQLDESDQRCRKIKEGIKEVQSELKKTQEKGERTEEELKETKEELKKTQEESQKFKEETNQKFNMLFQLMQGKGILLEDSGTRSGEEESEVDTSQSSVPNTPIGASTFFSPKTSSRQVSKTRKSEANNNNEPKGEAFSSEWQFAPAPEDLGQEKTGKSHNH